MASVGPPYERVEETTDWGSVGRAALVRSGAARAESGTILLEAEQRSKPPPSVRACGAARAWRRTVTTRAVGADGAAGRDSGKGALVTAAHVVGEEGARRESRSFAARGAAVRAVLPEVPSHLRRGIDGAVRRRSDDGGGELVVDLLGLLACPAPRGFVLNDRRRDSTDLWAALASLYVAASWRLAPRLAGRYVLDLVPVVAWAVRPMAATMRVDRRSELWLAASDPRRKALRLSALGPLAIFFLLSVARTELAWEALVDASEAPRRRQAFGWAPGLNSLAATVRYVLTGQSGRRFRRKALLYSPLARYLRHLGLVQCVPMVRGRGAGGPRTADAPARQAGRWLLGCEYLARCASGIRRNGHRVALVDETRSPAEHLDPQQAASDARTERRAPAPEEEVDRLEARRRAIGAAKLMLQEYTRGNAVRLKRLLLWAHAAGLKRPEVLLASPSAHDERTWAALIEALLADRVADRAAGVRRVNRQLPLLAARLGVAPCTPFTTTQFGTYMTRLRRHYRAALRQVGRGAPV